MTPMTPESTTVVLIHGLWMTPLAWEHWAARYEARGVTVLTPGYPGIGPGEGGVQALRDHPDAVAGVGVREVMDHLTEVISKLAAPPVIMGHSFGGTFAQLLVGNGLGSAGVSIDGAGVKGVKAMPFSELHSTFPVLRNPANSKRGVGLTPREFHYAFTNTLTEEESRQAYDRYHAPTPGKILFQGGLANFTHDAATTYNFAGDERAPSGTPPRPPRTRRSPAGITSPAGSPAGRPSPTSPSTGRWPPCRASSASPRPSGTADEPHPVMLSYGRAGRA